MKIAFIGNSLGPGGAQKMLAYAMSCVYQPNEEIIVILEKNEEIVHKIPVNTKVFVVDLPKRNNGAIAKLLRIRSFSKQVRKIIKDNKIDVACAFGHYYSLITVIAKKGTNTKVIGSERRNPYALNRLWKRLSAYAYKRCDALAFQTPGARDFYKDIPISKTVIIPNPYTSNFDSKFMMSSKREKRIVMAAARLEYEKGFDVGIKAFAKVKEKYPDYLLEIYGAGDSDILYGDLIKKYSLERKIIFKGLSRQIIQDIHAASVFVLPSRSEGIPNMLMEAMGAGLPCVAADCRPGGARLLIGDNEYGLIVPVEDDKETANAIMTFLSNNDFSDEMSKKAMQVKERFNPTYIMKLWQDCFRKALSK